jgi:hypothetical protein
VKAVAITSPDRMAEVQAAMAADNGHNVPCVSHELIDDSGRLRGAFTVVYAPVLFFWMDTRCGHPLASARGIRAARAELVRLGHHRIILPIQRDSPYYPFVASIGFLPMGAWELFEFASPPPPHNV